MLFAFSGQAEMFEVPTCVTTLTIEAFGAQGNPGTPGGSFGLGGQATGTLPVVPGDVLTITVGVKLSCLKRQDTRVSTRGTGPPAASHTSPLARPSKAGSGSA